MAKARNQFEAWASEAAARMDRAHAAGEQLSLLPPEPDAGAVLAEGGRGKGKTGSQLRAMLAARGLRMPEDVLAEMAGLASSQDAFVTAMQRTEQLMAWAYGDAAIEGEEASDKRKLALGGARVALFQQLYAAQLRALDALMPYGLAKVSGDGAPQQVVQVVVAGAGPAPAPVTGPATARDVTPQSRRIAPPPMPHEIQQNQQVAEPAPASVDDQARTKGASR